jgi:hypothetical protein
MYPSSGMATKLRAPPTEYASPGANPTLETIEYVRAILRQAELPVSRNAILRELAAWNHSTTRKSLNAALEFLGADGNVAEGSKGLIWVPEASGSLLEAIRQSRRL